MGGAFGFAGVTGGGADAWDDGGACGMIFGTGVREAAISCGVGGAEPNSKRLRPEPLNLTVCNFCNRSSFKAGSVLAGSARSCGDLFRVGRNSVERRAAVFLVVVTG